MSKYEAQKRENLPPIESKSRFNGLFLNAREALQGIGDVLNKQAQYLAYYSRDITDLTNKVQYLYDNNDEDAALLFLQSFINAARRNIEANKPSKVPRTKFTIALQKLLIKIPVKGAAFINQRRYLTQELLSKRGLERRKKNISMIFEHSVQNGVIETAKKLLSKNTRPEIIESNQRVLEQINLDIGLNEVRKELLQTDFYDESENQKRAALENKTTEQLHQFFSNILEEPFKIARELFPDIKPDIHPVAASEKLRTMSAEDLRELLKSPKKADLINKLEPAIKRHQILVSLLDKKFSAWRNYAELNLSTQQIIASNETQEKKRELLQGVTFNESRIIIDCIKTPETEIASSEQHTIIQNLFAEAASETVADDYNEWDIGNTELGKSLKKEGFNHKPFTGLSRSLEETDSGEQLLLPTNFLGIVTINESNEYDARVELTGIQQTNLVDIKLLSKMLQDLMKAKGNKQIVEKNFVIYQKEYDIPIPIPKLKKLLARVATIPLVIINTKPQEIKNVNELNQKAIEATSRLRNQYSEASMIMACLIDSNGNLIVSANADHVAWDGQQTKTYVDKILRRLHAKLEKKALLKEQGAITTEQLELGKPYPDLEELKDKPGNYPVEIFVNAELFTEICRKISAQVKELVATEEKIDGGKLGRLGKLGNPAIIQQLILIHEYRKFLKQTQNFPDSASISILMGNSELTNNLDLAATYHGIDIELYNRMNPEAQILYLTAIGRTLEQAFKHTNLELVKETVNNIKNKTMQRFLNKLSQTFPLLNGLKEIAGRFMVSSFGIPRLENGIYILEVIGEKIKHKVLRVPGPATAASFQEMGITLNASSTIINKETGKEELILSIQVKNTNNEQAHAFAQYLARFIQSEAEKNHIIIQQK